MNSSAASSAASPSTSSRTKAPARLVLVGVRGFGQVHATNIGRLADLGLVELVAAVDPGVVLDPPSIYGADLYADLAEALAVVGPVDVVVIAAPIGAHSRLAEIALAHGADVLLEKPPVASLADFHRLLDTEQRTGRAVQVGFQSLGSAGLELFESGAVDIGRVLRVGAVGAWSRTVGYWSRSPWAGRRSLGGQAVVDGVVTNPLAHAVATALAVNGCRRLEDVASVETDLYRANAIDADDTSVVRITTADGSVVTCALSLCAPEQREPLVHVYGTRGRATFDYKTDRIEVFTSGGTHTETAARTDLLENLLAHRRDGTPLLVPLASTGAFMRVFDAVAHAEEPIRIDPRAIRWSGDGQDRRPIVDDIEHWLDQAAATGRTFAELGVPWAHRERDQPLVRLDADGVEVAVYRDGGGTIPTSSPRPYLHPVRTRAGVVVSAHHPADHDWHLGVGVAIPDANGTSFWGGGTYIHGQGYVLLNNHGLISRRPTRGAGRVVHPPAAVARSRRISRARGAAVRVLDRHRPDIVAVDLRHPAADRPGPGAQLTRQQGATRRRLRRLLLALSRLRRRGRVHRRGAGRGRGPGQRGPLGGLVGRLRRRTRTQRTRNDRPCRPGRLCGG